LLTSNIYIWFELVQIEIVLIFVVLHWIFRHAVVSTSKNNGHSCDPRLSTPFNVDMVLNTLWTQIEVVELTNDGSGLGFGISGNKSTGVVVKAIVPGSIADKDGRIHTGDHLFQINHVYVRGMSAEQVAGILRQCSQEVRLVVARSVREGPPTTTSGTSNSPSLSKRSSLTSENLSRTRHPSSSMMVETDGMINNLQKKIFLRTERLLESNHNLEKILDHLLEQCQNEDGTQLLEVTLDKGDDGLGITVAGYVSPDSTNHDAIAGIFIRDIAEESVSARDGRLAIGDQIIEVNDQSLNGFSNVQALYLLQNTSSSVRLKVRRYLDGTKYEKIKEMIALESSHQNEEKLDFDNQSNINEQISQKWTNILGNNSDILIIDAHKPDNGSLGITLEGTIDVESGEEIGSHHYIRTVLNDGILGREGTLKSGDELLEINSQILYGKDHIQVIEILKRIKGDIKLICARRKLSSINGTNSINGSIRSRSISFGKTTEIAVKAKSLGKLNAMENYLSRLTKSRSLEVISNLAFWSKTVFDIELNKGENGLGFSVLDYQDPSNPSYSPVIVIRALVPGGVTQLDGRVVPGDRLVAVNDITLENMTLDDVIKILKSTPKGLVKLSLAKPLPYPKLKNDNDDKIVTDSDQDVQTQRRSSRLSKSKTTSSIKTSQQRSKSSHRSIQRKPAVPAGIALSAPAILSRHEYVETLLTKENLRKKVEQRASSAGRRGKPTRKSPSLKKLHFKSERIRSMHSHTNEIYTTFVSSSEMNGNLPEFIRFESDHLVLSSILNSPHSLHDRLRNASSFVPQKFARQSSHPNSTANSDVKTSNPSNNKRLSRARHSYDTTIYHEKQQQQQGSSKRTLTTKFDSISCFQEPELSSDENQYSIPRSPSLTNRTNQLLNSLKTNVPIDDDADDEICQIIPPPPPEPTTSLRETSSTPTKSFQTFKCLSSSHRISPTLSTSSQSSGRAMTSVSQELIPLPEQLEHEILIKQNFDQLGLIVDATVDGGVNGCYIRSVSQTPVCNCLKVGDFIVSLNNERMRKINNAQARAIIRQASLIGSDISLVFIPGDEAKKYKADIRDVPSINSENVHLESETNLTGPTLINDNDDEDDAQDMIDTESLCSTLWGSARTVVLYRNEHSKSLGISIVGGKLDFSGPGNTIETCISGIFVKHVIPDSPAGRHSTLKTGDRILEVNGTNLRDATHDHAVEIIRSSQSPIYFIVQSLLDPSHPTTTTTTTTNEIQQQPEPIVVEDPLIKQYEHLDGQILRIDLKRNPSELNEPLGLSLIGHRDPTKLAVFVCDVHSNSFLGRDKRIHPGDQLLQVNDEILLGKAHSTVTSIIKSIKSETLTFILLRNSKNLHEMALNNPYTNAVQHDTNVLCKQHAVDTLEAKSTEERATSTSGFPLIKHQVDHKDTVISKKTSYPIRPTNDVRENDNKIVLSDLPFPPHPVINESSSPLLNQDNHDLLARPSSLSTQTNDPKPSHPNSDRNQQSFYEPAVSHIPIMSSSSSSSSLSVPTPTIVAPTPEHRVTFAPETITNEFEPVDENPRTRPILVGKETLIEIDRGQLGLGLSVVGGSDTQLSAIIIHDIYDGCAAQRDGRLQVGDQILEVNSINLRSATHDETIQALRQSTHLIRLVVYRGDIENEDEKFDIISVELTKRAGKGLGFSIIGRRHGCGVFISHIIEGGSAEKDGRLMSGDLIVEVNGKDLRTAAYEQVAYTLKTLPHGRVEIKIGRLKANARRNLVSHPCPKPSQ